MTSVGNSDEPAQMHILTRAFSATTYKNACEYRLPSKLCLLVPLDAPVWLLKGGSCAYAISTKISCASLSIHLIQCKFVNIALRVHENAAATFTYKANPHIMQILQMDN